MISLEMAIVRESGTRSGIRSRTAIRADGAPWVWHVRARSQVKPVGRVLGQGCSKKRPEPSQAGAWYQVMCAVQVKIRTRFISTWLACFRFRNSWGVACLRFLFWNGPAKKSGISITRAKEPFKKFLGALLAEKRSVPTLVRVNHRLQN